jgi:hypothetical protein
MSFERLANKQIVKLKMTDRVKLLLQLLLKNVAMHARALVSKRQLVGKRRKHLQLLRLSAIPAKKLINNNVEDDVLLPPGTMLQPVPADGPANRLNAVPVDHQVATVAAAAAAAEQTPVNYVTQIVRDAEVRLFTLTGLEPNTLYVVFVQAVYHNTSGVASNMVYLHTSEDGMKTA